MNQNQFSQIARRMDQRFGHVRRGDEDVHMDVLMSLELGAYQVHLKNSSITSNDMQDAICLVLYRIQETLSGTHVDTEKFENDKNLPLMKAILSSFDPDESTLAAALYKEAEETFQGFTEETYYGIFVRALLRILDSVQHWTKEFGSGGYFTYLDGLFLNLAKGIQEVPPLSAEQLKREFEISGIS